MSSAKIAITLDGNLLSRLDDFVDDQKLPSRSRAIQQAILEKLDRATSSVSGKPLCGVAGEV